MLQRSKQALSVALEPWQFDLKCDAAFEFALNSTAAPCKEFGRTDAANQTIGIAVDDQQCQ